MSKVSPPLLRHCGNGWCGRVATLRRPNVAAGQNSVLIAQLQVRQKQTTVAQVYAIGAGVSALVAYPLIEQPLVESALAVVAIAGLMMLLGRILSVRRSIPTDPAQ